MEAEQHLCKQLVNQIGGRVYERVNRPVERAIAACVLEVFSEDFYAYLWIRSIEKNTAPILSHIRQLIAVEIETEREAE
jgi:hypothetical protein